MFEVLSPEDQLAFVWDFTCFHIFSLQEEGTRKDYLAIFLSPTY